MPFNERGAAAPSQPSGGAAKLPQKLSSYPGAGLWGLDILSLYILDLKQFEAWMEIKA
jgi:hypothetical protein